MPLSPEQLGLRWQTQRGHDLRNEIRVALEAGRQDWEQLFEGFEGVDEVPNHRDLRHIPLDGLGAEEADLSSADLAGARLVRGRFKGANLANANLSGSDLSDANFESANLAKASLIAANLTNAGLSGADLRGAYLGITLAPPLHSKPAKLSGAVLEFAKLNGAKLHGVDMTDAKLSRANLADADLSNADLTSAILRYADLARSKLVAANLTAADLTSANLTNADLRDANLSCDSFRDAKFIKTRLAGIRFNRDHDALNDYSSTIVCSRGEKLADWGFLRRIGQLPLFGVSWLAFVLALAVTNGIGMLNETRLIQDWVQYPIPIPHRMFLILIDSILLVLGTTVFKLACPSNVQEFSQAQWVLEHRQPRLPYLRDQWSRYWLRWITVLFSITGAALGLYLIIERVFLAFKYLIQSLV